MPGLTITTGVRSGSSQQNGDPAARAFMVGIAARGPAGVATSIKSLNQFVQVFGDRQAGGWNGNLFDAVRTFFATGGREAVISRVVGAAAVNGSVSINDRATPTPAPTVKFTALNPGAYSAGVAVSVSPGAVTGVTVGITSGGVVAETWPNLADVPTIVATLQSSAYVRATDLGSAAADPAKLPAVTASAPLVGGVDDRGTVTAAAVTAGLNSFGAGMGVGAVMCPGYPADQVGVALRAHAEANGRIALLAGPVDAQIPSLLALAIPLAGSKSVGLFGPWIVIPDQGLTRTIDPVSYVAGARSKAINDVGFWQCPAGDSSASDFILGTAWQLDEAGNNLLAAGGVSGIITNFSTGQAELFGYYSQSPDGSHQSLLSNQDTMNSITNRVREILHPYVWKPIDGRGIVFGKITGDLTGMLQTLADAGAFYAFTAADGTESDPGYSVAVDGINNPPAQLGANRITGLIGVRLDPVAADLVFSIVQVGTADPVN